MTRKKILITGGAGFIGSHLTERLLDASAEVTILDDLSTGHYSNIAHLEERKGLKVIVGSVLDENLVEHLVRSVDTVYHLASAVGVKLIIEQPVRTISATFLGTEVVLRYCSRYRKPILITSSSEVYGKGVSIPFAEDDDVLTGATTKHRWAYACSKSLDEFLGLAHWRETRLPVAVVRLFNTVGPRQAGQYGMVLPRFVSAALHGEPLLVHGDGKQSRCFAHVHDVVDGLVSVLENSSCLGQVINLGNNMEISINDLAKNVISLLGSSSPIRHVPYHQAYGEGFEDMLRRVPSLEKAWRLFRYRPKRNLKDIIIDTAASLGWKKGAARKRLSQGRIS